MKWLSIVLTVFLMMIGGAFCQAQDSSRLSFSLSTGYQTEDLRWSIAGNTQGTNPNILSELKWKKVSGLALSVDLGWRIWKGLALRSTYARLFISSGTVTDTDYQGDDRTDQTYFGKFDANEGSTYVWREYFEYSFHIGNHVTLTPGIGYSQLGQQVKLLSSDQTGSAAGLRSTYDTRYRGGVASLRGKYAGAGRLSVEAGVLADIVSFRGQADWNLIQTFRHPLSFQDEANGFNIESFAQLNLRVGRRCEAFVNARSLYGRTGKGTDMLYLQSGQDVPTRFNGAIRNVFHLGAGVRVGLF